MPPKGKDVKKGAVQGNYKAGKPQKDILPAGSKQPREGTVAKQEGDPKEDRHFEYEPLAQFPEWPGNEAALAFDFSAQKDENGEDVLFEDATKVYLPPSFREFQRDQDIWKRPSEYIAEVMHEAALTELKNEKRKQSKTRKDIRKAAMMSMGGAEPDISPEILRF